MEINGDKNKYSVDIVYIKYRLLLNTEQIHYKPGINRPMVSNMPLYKQTRYIYIL